MWAKPKNRTWGDVALLFLEHVIWPNLERELGLVIALVIAWLLGPHSHSGK